MPILYIIVMGLCPNLGTASNYLLTNMADWSTSDIALNNLVFGVLYTIIMSFILNKLKKIKFEYLMLLGGITKVLSTMSFFCMIKAEYIGYNTMFGIQLFIQFVAQFALDMPMIATIGRISQYLPEGFESTGVTLIIAIGNLGITASNLFAAREFDIWKAIVGYYGRLFWPVVVNTGYTIFVVLITSLFVIYKCEKRKANIQLNSVSLKDN